MPTKKKVEEVVENVCPSCKGTGRGPLEGVKETSCLNCLGTGKSL